jgi:hypothetical protein
LRSQKPGLIVQTQWQYQFFALTIKIKVRFPDTVTQFSAYLPNNQKGLPKFVPRNRLIVAKDNSVPSDNDLLGNPTSFPPWIEEQVL